MAREINAGGMIITEDGEEEYNAHGFIINEDQAAASPGVSHNIHGRHASIGRSSNLLNGFLIGRQSQIIRAISTT